jgi:hypothetical protein
MAGSVKDEMLPTLLSAYYSTTVATSGPLGEILISWVLNGN